MTISCQLSIITLLITSNIINHQLGPTNQSRLCLLFVPVVATQQRWEWWWRCSILVEIKTSRCRSRLPILICCWDAGRVVRVRLRVRVRVAILHLTDCRGGGWPLLWRGFGTWLPCHSFALGCNCNLHWFHRWLCFGFHLHGLHSFLCICTTAPGTCTSCGCGRHSFGTRHHKCWQWISSRTSLIQTHSSVTPWPLHSDHDLYDQKWSANFENETQGAVNQKLTMILKRLSVVATEESLNSQAKNSGFQMKECRTTNQPLI